MDLVTFAQSFHWMDRPRVAAAARTLLAPGGALVHVMPQPAKAGRRKHRPRRDVPATALGSDQRPDPAATWGSNRAPGRAHCLRRRRWRGGHLRGRWVHRPRRLNVSGWTVERSAEQVLAAVHSLSGAAPHLFGDRLMDFDADLRHLLGAASNTGRFTEHMPDIDIDIWR